MEKVFCCRHLLCRLDAKLGRTVIAGIKDLKSSYGVGGDLIMGTGREDL